MPGVEARPRPARRCGLAGEHDAERRRHEPSRLDQRELTTLARQAHASMARAIHPFHALVDGDVLYAVTTNEVESDQLESIGLGIVASSSRDAVLAVRA